MVSNHKKSILLVEDEALLALFEKNQLEKEGYEVKHVFNGEEAIRFVLIHKYHFDLILMDIDLGEGLDGTETATEILKEIQIPILFLSSHTERDIVQRTETITSYGYVVKNSGITVLDASIKMAFKLSEANEIMKSKRDHLETVLRSIGDAVIATDTDGRIQKMNPVAENLIGWKFDDVAGVKLKDIFKIVNANTRETVENPVDIVLSTDRTVGLANHTILISKEGKEYQIADSGSPIRDLNGETKGVVLVFRDVTSDYEIQSKINYQAYILENVLDSVIATDSEMRITYWNKAAEKIYGWKAEEVIGKLSFEILQTNFLNISREQVIQQIFEKGNYFGEVIQKRKDDSPIEIEVNTILLKDNNGQANGYIAVARDISERKQSRKRIDATESKLTQIIDTAMDAIISIDKDKKIVLFNRAAEMMFGYLAEERIGQSLDVLIPMEFRATHDKKIDHFSETGVSRRSMGELGQIHGLRSNGEIFPIEASISQITVNNEKLYTVILRDESLRSENENKIKKLLADKENILKEIHHRMKNNMTAIFTLLSMKADSQKEETTKTILLESAARVKCMAVLYDKLYYSDTNNSVLLEDYFPVILREIVDIFPRVVKLNVKIETKGISLGAKILSSVGIILNELITNSMKHAFKDHNKNEIFFEIAKIGQKMILVYSDNGIEIPPSVTTQNSSGFGLQLISMLVSQLGGEMEIGYQQGPKFKIRFDSQN